MMGDAVDDAYLVADHRGVVVDASQAACRMLGRSKAELVGLSLAPHSPPDILDALGRRWTELRRTGAIHGTAEIERPDGSQETVDFDAQLDLPIMGWTLVRLTPTGER